MSRMPRVACGDLSDQSFASQEFASYICSIAMLPIQSVIHLLHFLIGNLVFQRGNRVRDLRMLLEGLLSDNGDGLIRREIV